MSRQKLFIKETAATIQNGTAGLQIVFIDGKEWEGDVVMLIVFVLDVDDGLAGPYKVPENDTEVRDIEVAK